jgi:hypothetical protein
MRTISAFSIYSTLNMHDMASKAKVEIIIHYLFLSITFIFFSFEGSLPLHFLTIFIINAKSTILLSFYITIQVKSIIMFFMVYMRHMSVLIYISPNMFH